MTIQHNAQIVENNVILYATPDRIVLEFSDSFANALIQCRYVLENPCIDLASVEMGNPSQYLPEISFYDADGEEFETDAYEYGLESITVHATNPTLISVMFTTDLPGTQNFWVKFPYTALK